MSLAASNPPGAAPSALGLKCKHLMAAQRPWVVWALPPSALILYLLWLHRLFFLSFNCLFCPDLCRVGCFLLLRSQLNIIFEKGFPWSFDVK